MPHAIRIHTPGGPENMVWEEVEVRDPGKGEVRIRHTAVGVNYIDTYHRSGLYPIPTPFVLGSEAAGVVTKVGKGVRDLKVGQRVTYAGGGVGSYAEERTMPVGRVIPIPNGIKDEEAAAMMLKGMTSEYLLRRVYKVKKGDFVLFHAAAGGVGLIACQWAKSLGAKVIGTVSTDEKAALAKKHGCAHTIVYSREDFVARVKEITKGKGVPVAYDGVGKDTIIKTLDCMAPRGMVALFGQASGPVTDFNIGLLASKGALFITRPSLVHYTPNREELLMSAKALFSVVKAKKVKIEISARYALKDAAQAHRDLQDRKTTGSIVLVP